jgi:hypothetical protein
MPVVLVSMKISKQEHWHLLVIWFSTAVVFPEWLSKDSQLDTETVGGGSP